MFKMPKKVWVLVIGMAINFIGMSFLWPMHTIFMSQYLGQSLTTAGIVLMLNSFFTMAGSMYGGRLFDKVGGYKTVMTGAIITFVSLIGLVLFHNWPFYAIFMTLNGLGNGMITPAIFAMAGVVWPEGGRKTFNAIYLAQNLGVSIGTAVAGFIAEVNIEFIFIGNFLLFLVFLVIAVTQFKYDGRDKVTVTMPETIQLNTERQKKYFYALLTICVMFFLAWTGYVQWITTLSTYIQSLDISLSQYGLIWTVNGLLIVIGQPVIAPIIRRFHDNLKIQMYIGLTLMIVSFIFTAFQSTFAGFVVGMMILTFGEMFVWPAIPTIANQLAPSGKQGAYQGIVNSTATLGRAIGPLIGGIAVDVFNMRVLFILIVVILVIGYYFIAIFDRNIKDELNESS